MSSTKLTCLSLNVNGMRARDKRQALFHLLCKSSGGLAHDVVMLQETHHVDDVELASWMREGVAQGIPVDAHAYASAGSTLSAGVVLLFASHLPVADVQVRAASQGRLLLVTCTILDHPYCFVNVYAPHTPSERTVFFSTHLQPALSLLDSHQSPSHLWGGDWNCIECPVLDQSNPSAARETGFHEALAPIVANMGMHDAFRCLHPFAAAFSFSRMPRQGTATHSRLDRWYVDDTLLPHLVSVSYADSLASHGVDHRACMLSVRIPHAPCMGKGVWSFPQRLLWDDRGLPALRGPLESWLRAHPVSASLSPVQRWLQVKLFIKHQSIMIGKRLAWQRGRRQAVLQGQVLQHAAAWGQHPASAHHATAYHAASLAASEARVEEARTAARLAGVAWDGYGERCTAWFHRLGRQRKQVTVINTVTLPVSTDPVHLNTPQGTAVAGNIIADFFDSNVPGALFFPGEVDGSAQQQLLGALDARLSQGDRAACDADLTLEELAEALRECARSKRPGLDGSV